MLADDPESLWIKAYFAIATAMTGRGVEVHDLPFPCLKLFAAAGDEGPHATVSFGSHAKQTKAASSDGQLVMVAGTLEMQAINNYAACFKHAERKG